MVPYGLLGVVARPFGDENSSSHAKIRFHISRMFAGLSNTWPSPQYLTNDARFPWR